MRFPPVVPADLAFEADGTPCAPGFGDVYHPRAGAMDQARAVFLAGNALPQRWQGRERFLILETGFGLGHNFLATWQAWRQDPHRPQRLHFVSVEKHPVPVDAVRRAYERHAGTPLAELAQTLLQAWPAPSPDLIQTAFDEGRVVLQVVHADVTLALRELRLQADAVYLDGFSPRCNAEMWSPPVFKALARLAAPGCTAATWSAARVVREGLQQAGFEVEKATGPARKRDTTRARQVRTLPPPKGVIAPRRWSSGQPPVVVIGAGLAGAACAAALSAAQVPCVVLEAQAEPALGASGNPAGLVHGVLHAEDGAHARLGRAAAWMAQRTYAPLVAQGHVAGRLEGLLRRETRLGVEAMRALVARLGLPESYVQVRETLSDEAGDRASGPAWFYPGGGWIDPAAWVQHAMRLPGVQFRGSNPVQNISRQGSRWQVFGPGGAMLAETEHLVLCPSAQVLQLLPRRLTENWPVGRQRGQITRVPLGPARSLAIPISGGGYALSLPDGDLLCGATASRDDEDPSLRAADHLYNLERAQRLIGPLPPIDPSRLGGRVGWRFHADDRLPLVGPVPAWATPPSDGSTRTISRLRDIAPEPGLYMLTGLGSRGITWAPLLGLTLASWITGDPWPLPGSLVDSLDPRRFALRTSQTARPAPSPADRSRPGGGQTPPPSPPPATG